MAGPFVRVRPGDLVASDLFNRLLDAFEALDKRVEALEGTPSVGDVAILSLVPAAGTVKVGEVLKGIGFGFGLSLGACRVFLNDTEIPAFLPGSNDQALNFLIPPTAAGPTPLPPVGRPVVLMVRGPRGTARRTITIIPSAPVAIGTVELSLKEATSPVQAGQPARFRYAARSLVPAPASVVLSAAFTGVANPAAWKAASSFVRPDNAPLPGGRLDLAAGEVGREFVLVVAPVPAGDARFAVAVSASSDDAQVTGSSGELEFPVGQPAPLDPNIEVGITSVTPPGVQDGGVIALAPNKGATVTLTAVFKKAGTYTIADPAATGADWSASRTTPATVQVAAGTTPFPATLTYTVRAGAAPAPADGAVSFPVRNDAGGVGPTIRFTLKRGA